MKLDFSDIEILVAGDFMIDHCKASEGHFLVFRWATPRTSWG